MSEYAMRDIEALGDFYMKHLAAMTAEGLYGKGDIAAELAFRDAEIDRLRKESAAHSTPPAVKAEIRAAYRALAEMSRQTARAVHENAQPSGVFAWLGIHTTTS